ncbi:MAG TPA: DNA internalization-related competence protein ComEC/Rec2 [Aquabacterium sp.]|nr:DNA internalization-related competence protein ComEC/Rec2 [Aquabacterium sp.]
MGWWVVAMTSWVAGVWFQVAQPQLASPGWFGGTFVMSLIGLIGLRHVRDTRGRTAVLVLVVVGLSWSTTSWRAWYSSQSTVANQFDGHLVTVRIQIDSLVQQREGVVSFEARVLRYDGGTSQPGWPLRLQLHGRGMGEAELRPGQQWLAQVRLSAATGASNPGGFDLALLNWERGIGAVGQIRPASLRLIQQQPEHAWQGLIDRWRQSIRERIDNTIAEPRWAAILAGLTIGDQSAIGSADWDLFRATGIGHLVSISGSHVAMLGYTLAWLILKLWPRMGQLAWRIPSPYASQLGGLAGAIGYAVLAGWGVPAQRTVLMMAAVTLLKLSGRRWPWPLVWLFAAVVVTAWDPWSILQPGFWLSFVAVGILMSMPSVPLLQQSNWRIRWRDALHEMVRIQWRVSIGLAPLTLVLFQQTSWISFPANLLAIPVFTFLITPLALLGVVCAPLWHVAVGVLQITLSCLSWLAQWNRVAMQVPQLPTWMCVLTVAAGALVISPMRMRWRLTLLPFLLPLLYLPDAWQLWPRPPSGQFTLLAADVGQGTAVLIRTESHSLLFDTGPKLGSADAGQRVLLPLLRAVDVHHLDRLVLSHADMDHVGGAVSILHGMTVDDLWTSLPESHPLLRERSADGLNPVHRPCVAGQSWVWDDVRFSVLHPTLQDLHATEGEGDNARSCVVRIEALKGAHRVALLTGDIETAQEARLVESGDVPDLRSDVLLVPHHGSKTSSTASFLERVGPSVAVVQAGRHNRYGHPAPVVMDRYRGMGIPVVTTIECGAYFWRSEDSPPGLEKGSCWRLRHVRYWHPQRASAGSDS